MEVRNEMLTVEEQQAKLLKKMHRMDMIRTAACAAVAVAVIVMALVTVPQLSEMLTRANTALAQLTEITEQLSSVDFEGMEQSILQLADTGTETLAAAAEELTVTMQGMQEIDFAALAEGVENFNAISSGMARLFGK